MASIQDQDYLRICAELASSLSISISAARRKVDLLAARNGVKDLQGRKDLANLLVNKAKSCQDDGGENSPAKELDHLLEALAEDENFMVED